MRTRVSAALVMAAALVSLTACQQSSPDVAAYLGSEAITEARVTQLLDGFNNDERVSPDQRTTRQNVLATLINAELCERIRRDKGFSVPEPQLPDNPPEYLVIAQKAGACIEAMPVDAKPVTDQDINSLLDKALAAGLLPPGTNLANEREALRANPELPILFARENALQAAGSDVRVNPRYAGVAVSGGFVPILAKRVGDTSGGVVQDRPATSAPQQ